MITKYVKLKILKKILNFIICSCESYFNFLTIFLSKIYSKYYLNLNFSIVFLFFILNFVFHIF